MSPILSKKQMLEEDIKLNYREYPEICVNLQTDVR